MLLGSQLLNAIIGLSEQTLCSGVPQRFLLILVGLRLMALRAFVMPAIVMADIRADSGRLRVFRSVLLHQRGALVVCRLVLLLILLLEILFLLFELDGILDLLGTIHYLLMIVEGPLVDVVDV